MTLDGTGGHKDKEERRKQPMMSKAWRVYSVLGSLRTPAKRRFKAWPQGATASKTGAWLAKSMTEQVASTCSCEAPSVVSSLAPLASLSINPSFLIPPGDQASFDLLLR